ncbi:trypsin-like peptidase domain-containing protein [Anaerobacillus sp. CMMVII]|uniref:S1C family serine protease n=1 Tax=Anaerobacillus sp. CMMVII TaxID=2755588 RepID=UPI0021B7F63F|nr:serine protease [Anaerobacillus sp. CMMVII]MCT8138197.1 trypsin-like peptidase domain-containing protein [Anaerobacillus sp. CMMVII]
MRDHKDDDLDELEDPNWEPSPEDFLFEEIDEEEQKQKDDNRKKWVKGISIVVAAMLVFQIAGVFFSTFSIDAIRFLQTSYRLSQLEEVKEYKQAVVTVQGERSRGTGFSISDDGLIVTNHHVIEGQNKIMVGFHQGELFEGEVISSYPEIDIAFLRVSGKDLPYLPLSENAGLKNENIYVIGNPLSWTQIANEGEILENEDLTIISAPIYRGNSGSPVINMEGEVVAVVFAKRRTTAYGGKSVGLAVPIEIVLRHMPNGDYSR